jgi:hypothetical protein
MHFRSIRCPFARLLGALWSLADGRLRRRHAGAQIEEQLSASVQASLQAAISDRAAPRLVFDSESEATAWLNEMSARLATKIPDATTRSRFPSRPFTTKRRGQDSIRKSSSA